MAMGWKGGNSLMANGRRRLIPLVGFALALLVIFIGFTSFGKSEKVYGLMIDAGSTGSRMHTFEFAKTDSGELKLLKEDFNPIKPGLSAYKDDPAAAGKSLAPLLEKSKKLIPRELHSSTPVYLRATAGLRMLGGELAEKILENVRTTLQESGFRFDDRNWAGILDGNDEGIYSWITVNYLMERPPEKTAGTLEMGGGSSQIAFVPTEDMTVENCKMPSEDVEFKGKDLDLYTVSHLGFGIKKAKADVMKAAPKDKAHPCLNKGSNEVEIPFEDPPKIAKMEGDGSFVGCSNMIDNTIMAGAGDCSCGICTYGKKPQPHATADVYVAMAFYAERTTDLGLKNPVTMKDIREFGEKVCKMPVGEVKKKFPEVANGDATELCFDLAFIYQHLSEGHGIKEATTPEDKEPEIIMAKTLKGIELGWSLGAMFQELSKLSEE